MFAAAGHEESGIVRAGIRRRRLVAAVTSAIAFLLAIAGPVKADLAENFNLVPPAGWTSNNQSQPPGSTAWFQGNSAIFASHQGAPNAYAAANYNNTGTNGDISNWLITPKLDSLSNGDSYSFFTRTGGGVFADRMEIRTSSNGSCSPGTGFESTGDFSVLLVSVNPDLAPGVYPGAWTEFSGMIDGLPAGNSSGCLAFRYFVTDSGNAGTNGDYIGVDTFRYTDTEPPSALTITGTDPVSPATDTQPRVQGTGALPGGSVNIYGSTNCSGNPIGTGSAADFNGAGIVVNVPAKRTTSLSADLTAGPAKSVCSNVITYTNIGAVTTTTAKCKKATAAVKKAKNKLQAAKKKLKRLKSRKAVRAKVRHAKQRVRKSTVQVKKKTRARRAACA